MMQRPGRRSQADLEAQDPRVALADCQKALREAQDRCAQLEADRVRLESILEGSQDAIWSWNTDGVVVRWNAAAKKLLGYAADEIVVLAEARSTGTLGSRPSRYGVRSQGRLVRSV